MAEVVGAPRVGVRLGVDVGAVRVGVARSDPAGVLATPLATVPRDEAGGSDLAVLGELVVEHGAVEVVVGLPRGMSGTEGRAAALARAYGARLAEQITPVPVSFADERLTTVIAARTLAERGVRGRRQRAVVDQAAAAVILQSWLDARPGPAVEATGEQGARPDAGWDARATRGARRR